MQPRPVPPRRRGTRPRAAGPPLPPLATATADADALAVGAAEATAESVGAAVAVALGSGGGGVAAASVTAGAAGCGGGPAFMNTNAPTMAMAATTAPTPTKIGVLLLGGGVDGETTGGAAIGDPSIGAPSGNSPTSGSRLEVDGCALWLAAAAARALRSMMPESSRLAAVVMRAAAGADEGDALPPTLAVSALSEKSIEFSSRDPVGPGAGARAAGAAPFW